MLIHVIGGVVLGAGATRTAGGAATVRLPPTTAIIIARRIRGLLLLLIALIVLLLLLTSAVLITFTLLHLHAARALAGLAIVLVGWRGRSRVVMTQHHRRLDVAAVLAPGSRPILVVHERTHDRGVGLHGCLVVARATAGSGIVLSRTGDAAAAVDHVIGRARACADAVWCGVLGRRWREREEVVACSGGAAVSSQARYRGGYHA